LLLTTTGFPADYIGAKACASCHENESALWQKSDHFHAMQLATPATVLGDFTNTEVSFHNIKTRFFVEDKKHFIETKNEAGKVQKFKVLYTFGHQPLQQYLVEIGNGKLQAFNIAWDSRSVIDGGQRWFHLQPHEDISPEHPFFWQSHFQNWNSRCADCHSTDLKKNYNAELDSYDTQWSDINVACEACHGPGSDHLSLAQSNKLDADNSGLLKTGTRTAWLFKNGDSIASPMTASDDKEIDICGGCHSRRLPIGKLTPGAAYQNQYLLQLLSPGLYFPDGQIQDEVFVLGSFLQSKMYQKGVRCTNCHEPHSGGVKLPGNALCNQCHLPTTFDTLEHHGHRPESSGSFCVDCHMPERLYMGVDDRRDHSFVVPKLITTASENASACSSCHENKSPEWINESILLLAPHSANNTSSGHWSLTNQRSRNLDTLSIGDLSRHAADETLPAIIRATLIEQLANFPSRITLEAAVAALTHHDPMIRRAAAGSIGFLPAADRWPLLKSLADDKTRSVRFAAAAALTDVLDQLPLADKKRVNVLLADYQASLAFSLDSPSTQMAMAQLSMGLGDRQQAELHYVKALDISPGFVPALLNYAEFLRASARDPEVQKHLLKAIEVAPDSAGAQHAYGLYLVRQKQVSDAIPYLRKAATINDAQPRFSYVYAVALDSIGSTDSAIVHLKTADKRWPNQMDILNTLLQYADKQNQLASHLPYLSKLSALSPSSPLVKQLLQKYQSRQAFER
jgi:tetratricopeptide (TPR) repeat protein